MIDNEKCPICDCRFVLHTRWNSYFHWNITSKQYTCDDCRSFILRHNVRDNFKIKSSKKVQYSNMEPIFYQELKILRIAVKLTKLKLLNKKQNERIKEHSSNVIRRNGVDNRQTNKRGKYRRYRPHKQGIYA